MTETTYSNRAGGVFSIQPVQSVYSVADLHCSAAASLNYQSISRTTTAGIDVTAQYGNDTMIVDLTVTYSGITQQFHWQSSYSPGSGLPPVQFTFMFDLPSYTLSLWKGSQTIDMASPSTSSGDWLGYSWVLEEYSGVRADQIS